MQKINFQDTTVLKNPYVIFNDLEYEVQDGTYDGGTDLNASTFNTMQNNIETAIDNIQEEINNIYNVDWNNISYINTYSSYDETSFNSMQYTVLGEQVFIRGMIKSTSINPSGYNAIAGVLPTNARPTKDVYFIANNEDNAITVNIKSSGEIKVFNKSTSWISLDGINFFTN